MRDTQVLRQTGKWQQLAKSCLRIHTATEQCQEIRPRLAMFPASSLSAILLCRPIMPDFQARAAASSLLNQGLDLTASLNREPARNHEIALPLQKQTCRPVAKSLYDPPNHQAVTTFVPEFYLERCLRFSLRSATLNSSSRHSGNHFESNNLARESVK